MAVLANDVDPLGQGLRVVSAGAVDGLGDRVGQRRRQRDGHARRRRSSAPLHVNYTIHDARDSDAGQATGQLTVDVVGLPGAPPTPQATATNATATVTWGQAAANGSPIDDIQVQINGGDQRVSLGVTSSHVFTGLQNGVPVSFQVRAHNEAGWGPWSGASAPVTPDTQPDRPAAPTVTFGDRSLTVNWAPPTNQGSAITKYELEIGGGTSGVQQPGTTSYVWQNLQNGVNYQFRVTAINAAGRSESSAWSAAEHPLREPAAPGAPRVVQGDRYLDLSWGAAGRQRRHDRPVPGADGQRSRARRRRPRARRCAGATCPTAPSSSSRCGRATATPTGVRGARPRRPSSRAASRTRLAHPTATRGDEQADGVVGRARRPGLRDHRLRGAHQHRQPGGHRHDAHVHRADQRHGVHVHRAGPEQRRLGRLERGIGGGHPGRGAAAVRRRSRPPSTASARCDLTWPAANPATVRRSSTTRSRSTTARPRNVGNVTSYRGHRARPTRRRTRSGCGPATTSAAGRGARRTRRRPGARPTRSARRRSPPATPPSTPAGTRRRPTAAPIDHYVADIDPGGSKNGRRPQHVVGRAEQRHDVPGARPGLQRRRLRAVQRVGLGHPGVADATSTSPRAPAQSARRPVAAAAPTPRAAGSTSPPPGSLANTTYNWQCHASNGAFGSGGSATTDGNGRVSRARPSPATTASPASRSG